MAFCSCLKFHVQRDHNLFILLVTISYASYAFGVVLLICELGQRLTDAFDELCDTIEGFDWYLFPIDIQRMVPTLLIAAQKQVVLVCFGSISGTRDTFKRVSATHQFAVTSHRFPNTCIAKYFDLSVLLSGSQFRTIVLHYNSPIHEVNQF